MIGRRSMKFQFVMSRGIIPGRAVDTVYLIYDTWDDFGFRTTFSVRAFDGNGVAHELPRINIGYVGQTSADQTHTALSAFFTGGPEGFFFTELPEGFFSLCGSVEYYKKLYADFPNEWRERFLHGLRDLVRHPELLDRVGNEAVVQKSLLRDVRIDEVKDQYASVLRGEVLLSNFDFGFKLPASDTLAGFDLQFSVKAKSLPSTNMHALIGRNGVGKTTYLNEMIKAVSPHSETDAFFYTLEPLMGRLDMRPETYFGSLISVAFSAFDPFDQPPPVEDQSSSLKYSYVGLTDHQHDGAARIGKRLKTDEALHAEFVDALTSCFSEPDKKNRWKQAIETLQSDRNFSEMGLLDLASIEDDSFKDVALNKIRKMSSGHTIVLLSITFLVSRVDEKTLVLFDEPESHLQPPLLSALMRSLAQLLRARNAVAIIATHSPVVLQEIPKSCVWKVFRTKLASDAIRPEIETFGENVGTLTRDVFRLDVTKSGFHTILSDQVKAGHSYDEILAKIGGNLGYEAKGILRAMVANRDEQGADE